RRFGVDPTTRLTQSAYGAEISATVYYDLTRSACDIARAGYVGIVDAVFATDGVRQALRDAAGREGIPFLGLWLDAPVEVLDAR
ncbi:AAA family ATPase, partial [Streptomyces scabiei]|uniref:AAA family ATPase n=1 Tax=Streptomyces scabiei TaxID=1930 RepID=UPI0038F75B0E